MVEEQPPYFMEARKKKKKERKQKEKETRVPSSFSVEIHGSSTLSY